MTISSCDPLVKKNSVLYQYAPFSLRFMGSDYNSASYMYFSVAHKCAARNKHCTLLDSTYEAVFDRHQDIHVSDHDSECYVSDTGNEFYFIFHSHLRYHKLWVNIPRGGWGKVDVFII